MAEQILPPQAKQNPDGITKPVTGGHTPMMQH